MKFTAITSDIEAALSIASHAISSRTPQAIFECVLLETAADGVHLTCSDGTMTITAAFNAVIDEDGAIALPGKLFGDIIRRLPYGSVVFSTGINQIATLEYNHSRTRISGRQADLFPPRPLFEASQTVELPQSLLRNMIQQTSFAVSTDEGARKILTGCLLEIANGEARMVALDGFRLAVKREALPACTQNLKAVIPSRVISEISKISSGGDNDMITLSFGGSSLMLKMDRIELYASLLDGEYINYRSIIPDKFSTKIKVLDREQLALCIERAALIARDNRNNFVKFTIGDNRMTISAQSESGDVEEEVQVDTYGNDLAIAFNVRYLQDTLKAITDDELMLLLNTSINPCVFSPVTDNEDDWSYKYMVLPLRLNA